MLYFTEHFDNATFYRYLPVYNMNQFWFVSIRNEWGEGSSTEGGVQHQQESVCAGWCARGAGRTPISRPLQEHPPYPSPPGFHWSVFVVIRDVSPMFLWRMLIFTDMKVKMLTQDQTPTDLIFRLKSFSPAAYCIFMIILLLRLTCSMRTFSNVDLLMYMYMHDLFEEL